MASYEHSGTSRGVAICGVWLPDVEPTEAGRDSVKISMLVRTAARILDCPTANVTLSSEDQVAPRPPWPIGPDHEATSFADAVILGGLPEIVADATMDARFSQLLQVALFPKQRFLAGFPLFAPDGSVLGALVLADYVPRPLPPENVVLELTHLARRIADTIAGPGEATT